MTKTLIIVSLCFIVGLVIFVAENPAIKKAQPTYTISTQTTVYPPVTDYGGPSRDGCIYFDGNTLCGTYSIVKNK